MIMKYNILIITILATTLSGQYLQSQVWTVGNGLTVSSNALQNLTVKNNNRVVSEQGKILYETAVLNREWKEAEPFELSFTLSNAKISPYSYQNEEIYWGIFISLTGKDGLPVNNKLWFSSKKYNTVSAGRARSRYSYNINDNGWLEMESFYNTDLQKAEVKISYENGNVKASCQSSLLNSLIFAERSGIASIKSITLMIGSEVEMSVLNFKKEQVSNLSSNKNASNQLPIQPPSSGSNPTESRSSSRPEHIHSETECPYCHGTGEEKCTNFQCQNGEITCYTCNGSGEKKCRKCSATGYDYEGKRCTYCAGRGYTRCPDCHGRGYTKCDRCNGKGTKRCGYCNGRGVR